MFVILVAVLSTSRVSLESPCIYIIRNSIFFFVWPAPSVTVQYNVQILPFQQTEQSILAKHYWGYLTKDASEMLLRQRALCHHLNRTGKCAGSYARASWNAPSPLIDRFTRVRRKIFPIVSSQAFWYIGCPAQIVQKVETNQTNCRWWRFAEKKFQSVARYSSWTTKPTLKVFTHAVPNYDATLTVLSPFFLN